VFADAGHWWLISVTTESVTDVNVDAVDRQGQRARITGLCTDELASLDQLAVSPPAGLDGNRRTELEVRWRDHGDVDTYTISVRNDGMRSEHHAA
jgi:hypothetical protein